MIPTAPGAVVVAGGADPGGSRHHIPSGVSAPGYSDSDPQRRHAGRRAFTLLEMVLVIALLGLVGGLFISGGSELFRARERTATDVFWQAVQGARLQAVQEDTSVLLRYDEKKSKVIWSSPAASHELDWPGKNLEFVPVEGESLMLIAGQAVSTTKLPAVRFHADGGVDRFRAQLTDAAGNIIRLDLDPWTCAPVVQAKP